MISERVKGLIGQHIVSVEQLEVLLLLREEPARDWTTAQINDRIKSSVGSVSERLADLESRGFIKHQGESYRYDPGNPHEATMVELATTYAESRFTVIELIFAKPSDNLRVFARAFRIRGDNG
jgi:hypothetical protein